MFFCSAVGSIEDVQLQGILLELEWTLNPTVQARPLVASIYPASTMRGTPKHTYPHTFITH